VKDYAIVHFRTRGATANSLITAAVSGSDDNISVYSVSAPHYHKQDVMLRCPDETVSTMIALADGHDVEFVGAQPEGRALAYRPRRRRAPRRFWRCVTHNVTTPNRAMLKRWHSRPECKVVRLPSHRDPLAGVKT
jgi:hypothetical protein